MLEGWNLYRGEWMRLKTFIEFMSNLKMIENAHKTNHIANHIKCTCEALYGGFGWFGKYNKIYFQSFLSKALTLTIHYIDFIKDFSHYM